MCGILAYSGKTDCNQWIIELLIAWNSLERGEDATGLYSPKNGLKKTLTKGSEYVIYENKDYFEPDNVFIGHVRHATIGAKDKIENAHPFKRGKYVLAHNGTLKNHRDILHKYNLKDSDYLVDSDCIAGAIEASDNISEVLSIIDGAGAFVILNTEEPNKLYVFRNKERPLYRGYDSEGNMYISSIVGPMYYHGLTKIQEFKEDIFYVIENGRIVINQTRKLKNTPYLKPAVHTPYNNRAQYEQKDWVDGEWAMGYANRNPSNNTHTAKNKVDPFENVNLRAKADASYYDAQQGVRITFVKGEYYKIISSAIAQDRVWVEMDGSYAEVSKAYFYSEDVITNYDLVMLLEDDTKNTINLIVGNKGDIFQVNYMYPDSDISIRKYNDLSAKTNNYINKDKVRKLTKEEANKYYNDYYLKEHNINPDKTEEDQINSKQKELMFETSDEIMVNEGLLKHYFETLEDRLEDLEYLVRKSHVDFEAYNNAKSLLEKITNNNKEMRSKILITNSINV